MVVLSLFHLQYCMRLMFYLLIVKVSNTLITYYLSRLTFLLFFKSLFKNLKSNDIVYNYSVSDICTKIVKSVTILFEFKYIEIHYLLIILYSIIIIKQQ